MGVEALYIPETKTTEQIEQEKKLGIYQELESAAVDNDFD